jgi:carbonic anhydrase/acetyltransferase-like protein (isoleucine patch superfamily)
MKACVLDGAVVEKYAFVGAGALVTPNMHIPSGHLAVGVPAKVVRKLTVKEIQKIIDSAGHYLETARNHQAAYPKRHKKHTKSKNSLNFNLL